MVAHVVDAMRGFFYRCVPVSTSRGGPCFRKSCCTNDATGYPIITPSTLKHSRKDNFVSPKRCKINCLWVPKIWPETPANIKWKILPLLKFCVMFILLIVLVWFTFLFLLVMCPSHIFRVTGPSSWTHLKFFLVVSESSHHLVESQKLLSRYRWMVYKLWSRSSHVFLIQIGVQRTTNRDELQNGAKQAKKCRPTTCKMLPNELESATQCYFSTFVTRLLRSKYLVKAVF